MDNKLFELVLSAKDSNGVKLPDTGFYLVDEKEKTFTYYLKRNQLIDRSSTTLKKLYLPSNPYREVWLETNKEEGILNLIHVDNFKGNRVEKMKYTNFFPTCCMCKSDNDELYDCKNCRNYAEANK